MQTIDNMKAFTLLLTTITSIVILSSCKEYYDTFSIVNTTDKKIVIKGYSVKWSALIHRETIYDEVIEIQPNSTYSQIQSIPSSPSGVFKSSHHIDSVNIYFH